MTKVIFDANVYVSGLVFKGSPREVLALFGGIQLQIFISPGIAVEIKKALRAKFLWTEEKVDFFLAPFLFAASWVETTRKVKVCRDPKDDHILAIALEAKADYIVTGDKDLLVLKKFGKTEIVSPVYFLTKKLWN